MSTNRHARRLWHPHKKTENHLSKGICNRTAKNQITPTTGKRALETLLWLLETLPYIQKCRYRNRYRCECGQSTKAMHGKCGYSRTLPMRQPHIHGLHKYQSSIDIHKLGDMEYSPRVVCKPVPYRVARWYRIRWSSPSWLSDAQLVQRCVSSSPSVWENKGENGYFPKSSGRRRRLSIRETRNHSCIARGYEGLKCIQVVVWLFRGWSTDYAFWQGKCGSRGLYSSGHWEVSWEGTMDLEWLDIRVCPLKRRAWWRCFTW